jgi:hypothetical protein
VRAWQQTVAASAKRNDPSAGGELRPSFPSDAKGGARAGRNGGEAISDRSRKLPPGQHRYNVLQEIRRFRARITALHRRDLRPPHGGLKAKGK